MANTEANLKWLERGAEGAGIGTSIAPGIGTAIGAGVGTIEGLFEGWYLRNKSGDERRRLESLNAKIARTRNEEIERAILLQNESARSVIDKQLQENIRTTDINYAQSGAYRTGARIGAENQMRQNAVEAVARVAGQNALAGQQLKQSGLALDREYDLRLGQLEAAKRAGDTAVISNITEQLAPLFFQKLLGLSTGKAVNPENVSSSGMEMYLSDTTPETGQPLGVTNYQRPRTSFETGYDMTDPYSILFGGE